MTSNVNCLLANAKDLHTARNTEKNNNRSHGYNRRILSDHVRLRNGYYYCYTTNRTIMYTMLICRYNMEVIQMYIIHVYIDIQVICISIHEYSIVHNGYV